MDVITHLNCGNCQFTHDAKTEPVTKNDLNEQGGVDTKDKSELKRAKAVRLITLPGFVGTDVKAWCSCKKVDQWVTHHMWCTSWENGALRAWDKEKS